MIERATGKEGGTQTLRDGRMTVTQDGAMGLTGPKLTERWQKRVKKSRTERDRQNEKEKEIKKYDET